jgi:hypothetical protein
MRWALAVVVLSTWQMVVRADAPDAAVAEQALKAARIGTDGPALLVFFKDRTPAPGQQARLAGLIEQLGGRSYQAREKATAELMKAGQLARPFLEKGLRHGDEEVARRCTLLLRHLDEHPEGAQVAAAARLLANRRPAGAAEALLGYLPFATDGFVRDEIHRALPAVTVRDGKPEVIVLNALKNKDARKRAAAAEALMRAGVKEQVPAVRGLLDDADARVRLHAALGLVAMRDKTAVPALIDVLAELPPEALWPAEDVLVRLAGTDVPAVSLGTDEPTRKKARQEWLGWWLKHGARVDLSVLDRTPPLLGYTLIVQQTQHVVRGRFFRVGGEVLELDANKKVRWRIDVPQGFVVDAQVLPGDKVLIAEYHARRVSERDFKGNILWQQNVNGNPLSAQRQANGNTFIVTQNRLFEIDRNGKEVWSLQRPQFDILRAAKTRNGNVVFVTNVGQLSRLDSQTQKVLQSFAVGPVNYLFGSIDVLPNGHVLVPQFSGQRVVEFDGNGREVWQAKIQWPSTVMRLANGNTLVGSINTRRATELDRNGREVWSYTADGRGQLFQVRRR